MFLQSAGLYRYIGISVYQYIGTICKCKSLNLNSSIAEGNQQVIVRLKVKGFTEWSLDVNFTQIAFKNSVPNEQKYPAFQLEIPIC